MTSPDPTPAADDTSDRLVGLIERGFQFLHPTSPDGRLQAVVGVRVHGEVIDMVQLHAENDVTATRMPVGEADIMSPETVLWQTHGCVADVLDKVLSLPDEATSRRPAARIPARSPAGRPGAPR
ncbi:MAG: hypothetical protein ACRDQF_18870 [Thermocrispum sp.]